MAGWFKLIKKSDLAIDPNASQTSGFKYIVSGFFRGFIT